MNEKLKVLVFDDVLQYSNMWIRQLKEVDAFNEKCKVVSFSTERFKDDILEGLLERRRRARHSSESSASRTESFDLGTNSIDDIDILFIDFDLFNLDEKEFFSGEELAYLARCYSWCGLIVGVNYKDVPSRGFDLSLSGHMESFADLNIGDAQIADPGLWTADRDRWDITFRPWFWPSLPEALENFRKRVAGLRDDLDKEIFKHLEIPEEVVDIIPVPAFHFLTRKESASPSFREFVEKSGHGLRIKDETTEEFKIRIAAARIGKWLERSLLAGQDILADAPHILLRAPGLLIGDLDEVSLWNEVARLTEPNGMDVSMLSEYRFAKVEWLSRPAWFWPLAQRLDLPIPKIPDFVFCEDISSFRLPDHASIFLADLGSSQHVRRFIARPTKEGVKYYPYVALLN